MHDTTPTEFSLSPEEAHEAAAEGKPLYYLTKNFLGGAFWQWKWQVYKFGNPKVNYDPGIIYYDNYWHCFAEATRRNRKLSR